MDKKAESKVSPADVLVFVIIIVSLIPIILVFVGNADNQYKCLDQTYNIQSEDLSLCTNATYGCCGTLKTLNSSFTPPLCTNASGVRVANQSSCEGFLLYNESSTDVGLSTVETGFLDLAILLLVIAGIFMFAKNSGLIKKT
jgi:hypothetical protein